MKQYLPQKEKKKILFSRLAENAEHHRTKLYASIFCSVLSAVAAFLPFFCIYQAGSIVLVTLSKGQELQIKNLLPTAICAVTGAILAFALYYAGLLLGHITGFHIKANLKVRIFKALGEKRPGFFEQHPTGKIHKILDENTKQVEVFVSHQLPDYIASFSTLIILLLCMSLFDWRLGLVSVLPMILAFLLQQKMMNNDYATFMRRYQAALAEMNHHTVEYVRGISVIKIFGKEMETYKQFYRSVKQYQDDVTAYAMHMRCPMTMLFTLINVSFAFLIPVVFLMLRIGTQPTELISNFLFYIIISPLIATTLHKTMYLSSYRMMTEQALTQIEEMTVQSSEIKNIESLPSGRKLTFNNVTFTYPGMNKAALPNVSFSINPGETVSFVGRSGSGKSTIMKLLLRFYEE
jgi:ATP-binding cassette subfamily B protein